MDEYHDAKQNISSDFQMVVEDCYGLVSSFFNNTTMSTKNDSQFLDANSNQFDGYGRKSLSPRRNCTFMLETIGEEEEEDPYEPPLLEELEIYPEKIQDLALVMINPFGTNELRDENFLANRDLSGPIFFCLLFGSCLFLAGKVSIFSHVYGLAMISVLGMYVLLRLMCYGLHEQFITIKGVASALGYGMLHMVWFSFAAIFMPINTMQGYVVGILAVLLSTFSASRILSLMSNQTINRLLITYPTAIIYILFSFLILF